jgi:hypothetical protein
MDRQKVRTRTIVPFMNTVEEVVTNEIGWNLMSAPALFQISLQEHPQTGKYTQGGDERKMKFEWNELREGNHCVLGELQRDRARKAHKIKRRTGQRILPCWGHVHGDISCPHRNPDK